MGVSAQDVKELRDRTGVGMMDCKRALEQAGGDADKARQLLREKGLANARQKRGRGTGEGIVTSYVHPGSRIGVLLELGCETDFVARNEEFQGLARDLCMQVAASKPLAVCREHLPPETILNERRIYEEQAEGKPAHVVEKIVEGKLEKFFEDVCLVDQPYIRDESATVGSLIAEAIGKLGENIEVRRFARMELGEAAVQQ